MTKVIKYNKVEGWACEGIFEVCNYSNIGSLGSNSFSLFFDLQKAASRNVTAKVKLNSGLSSLCNFCYFLQDVNFASVLLTSGFTDQYKVFEDIYIA